MLNFNFNPFPVLETDRLLFERIAVEHAPRLFQWRSNEEVMRYIARPKPKTMADVVDLIHRNNDLIAKNEGLVWMLKLKDRGEYCGNILLWQLSKENHRAEVGYMLGPEFWRRGLVSEALQEVLRYAFQELYLHSIEANVDPRNEASCKLLEKTGFTREAFFRQNLLWEGEFLDTVIYSLLAVDWKAAR